MAAAYTVSAIKQPADPATGGHYTQIAPGQFQLIHAVGPGKWAPGPPPSAKSGVSSKSALLNPKATLSGQDLYNAAKALADAQTKGPLSELADQIAANERQTGGAVNQVGGYFNQLGQQASQGTTAEQAIANALNTQLAQIGTDTQTQLSQIGQNATTAAQQYSPQASANTTNPGLSGLTAELARQAGIAAQNEGASRSFGATQGANYSGLGAAEQGVTALKGQEDLTSIGKAGQVKNQPLEAKIAALHATYGADLATALGKLRQQEISNSIANAGLGIKAATVAQSNLNNVRTTTTSAANNAATTSTSAANNQRSTSVAAANNNPANVGSAAWQRVQAATQAKWSTDPNAVGSPAWARVQAAKAKTGAGGVKPLTTAENNAYLGKINTVQQLVRDGQAKHLTAAQIKGNLADGANPAKTKFDATMIEAAYELNGWGYIIPSTAASLKALGVTYRGKVANPPAAKPVGGNVFGGIGNTVAGALGA